MALKDLNLKLYWRDNKKMALDPPSFKFVEFEVVDLMVPNYQRPSQLETFTFLVTNRRKVISYLQNFGTATRDQVNLKMDRVKLALLIFCLLAGIGVEFALYKVNSTTCLILNGVVAYFSLIFWIITTCPSFQDQMQALIDRDATRQQEMGEDEPLINHEQDKAGPDHKQSQTNSEQGPSTSRSGMLSPQQGADDEIGGGHDQKNI